jgi:hypothetical protein
MNHCGRELAGKRVFARTSVYFESWRIEEPAVEESLETGLVEWMDLLVDMDLCHVSLEPAGVDEMC